MFKRIVLAAAIGWVASTGVASAQDKDKAKAGSPAETLLKEGKKLRDAKDHEGARDFFEAALKLEPRNVTVLVQVAWVHNELQDYEKAAKFAQDALKGEPSNSDAFSELGYSQLKQKQYLKAITSLRKAIDKDDKNITAYGYLAEALRAVGESDEADDIDAIKKKKTPAAKPKD